MTRVVEAGGGTGTYLRFLKFSDKHTIRCGLTEPRLEGRGRLYVDLVWDAEPCIPGADMAGQRL